MKMKINVHKLFSVLFIFTFSLFLGIFGTNKVYAQNREGSCTCIADISGGCHLQSNACAADFQPSLSCGGGSCSCSCELDSVDCTTITNSTECASTPGCYYYSGSCHSTPQNNSDPCNGRCDTAAGEECVQGSTGWICVDGGYSGPANGEKIRCESDTGINTAIGCIPYTSTEGFMGFILSWAYGIGGGIAFIMILIAGFQIMTSAGDPKKLQAGKELLTATIAGLVLLVLSAFVLRIIGVNILQIF